ncbi:MAG TPA: alkaline phosphatase, partial [Lentisphaeria bacterium]|nr:alkaline phosphatase [Lentisphaeria bacterium]
MRFQHLFFAAFLLLVGATQAAGAKYIFLFIGDGMAQQQRLMAEEYQLKFKKKGLVINSMPYQALTKTFSANAHVTDSAASGTAIACCEKTNNGYL